MNSNNSSNSTMTTSTPMLSTSQSTKSINSDLSNTQPSFGLLRKSFLCHICNKSASITERVRLQGLVYHRECIRCSICGVVVKNAENFSKRNSHDESIIMS